MKSFWRRDQIEDLALVTLLEFRRRTGLRLTPPIDVDLVGEIGCGLQWDWDVLAEPPSTRVWAALYPLEARVVMNEMHSAKFAASPGLERFTKAHEIGHWMLHVQKERGENSGQATPEYFVQSTLKPANESNLQWFERHANWFAAALLMPANIFVPVAEQYDLQSVRSLRQLAACFGVSHAALQARLRQLSLV